MKTIIFSIVLACVSIFQNTFAAKTHYETATFKVSGNCGMCKDRIESALKNNAGVKSASWNVDTKIVKVVYNPQIVSADQLQQLVADAGHDTDKIKATDASNQTLPECCQNKTGDGKCCAAKCCKGKTCVKDCCTADCTKDKPCTSECCKAACCK